MKHNDPMNVDPQPEPEPEVETATVAEEEKPAAPETAQANLTPNQKVAAALSNPPKE